MSFTPPDEVHTIADLANTYKITGREDPETAKKRTRDKEFSTSVNDHLRENLSAFDAGDFLERVKTLPGIHDSM